MSAVRTVVLVEAAAGLAAAVGAIVFGLGGVGHGSGADLAPDGTAVWTPVFDGAWIITAFAMAATAVLLLIDALTRHLRGRREVVDSVDGQSRDQTNRTGSPGRS